MYAEERQQAIARLVTRNRRVTVSHAADTFGVTTETARRARDEYRAQQGSEGDGG